MLASWLMYNVDMDTEFVVFMGRYICIYTYKFEIYRRRHMHVHIPGEKVICVGVPRLGGRYRWETCRCMCTCVYTYKHVHIHTKNCCFTWQACIYVFIHTQTANELPFTWQVGPPEPSPARKIRHGNAVRAARECPPFQLRAVHMILEA
jgi:hypothetical protein